jgi:hypothetical protein
MLNATEEADVGYSREQGRASSRHLCQDCSDCGQHERTAPGMSYPDEVERFERHIPPQRDLIHGSSRSKKKDVVLAFNKSNDVLRSGIRREMRGADACPGFAGLGAQRRARAQWIDHNKASAS